MLSPSAPPRRRARKRRSRSGHRRCRLQLSQARQPRRQSGERAKRCLSLNPLRLEGKNHDVHPLRSRKRRSHHASLLNRDRLIRRGRGSTRHDAFRSTLVKDFFWRNSEYEAEDAYFFLQQNASLIFESDGRVWFVLWTRRL